MEYPPSLSLDILPRAFPRTGGEIGLAADVPAFLDACEADRVGPGFARRSTRATFVRGAES